MKKIKFIFLPLVAISFLSNCTTDQPTTSKEYFVSFVADEAHENIPTQRVQEGKMATPPETPTRDGYTFQGWYSDSTLTTPFVFNETPITSDITLYADWGEIKTYDVNFYIDGVLQPKLEQKDVEYGQLVTRPDTPTVVGYVFDGWYTDFSMKNRYYFNKPLTVENDSLNLYGTFISGEVKVTYIANGGTIGGDDFTYVRTGDTILVAPEITKTNYECAGWYTTPTYEEGSEFKFGNEGTGTRVERPMVIYAKWEQSVFTIKWVNDDGKVLQVKQVKKNELAEYTGEAPVKSGDCYTSYSFSGWSPALAPATKDQIYVAKYSAKMCDDAVCFNIYVDSSHSRFSVELFATQCDVDWGDGTSDSYSSAGKSIIKIQHTYAEPIKCALRISGNVTGVNKVTSGGHEFIKSASLNDDAISVLGDNVFQECRVMETIRLSNKIETIPLQTFDRCLSLTSIDIPDSVKSIGNNAFKECLSLTSIDIPDSVKSIGSNAFINCSKLASFKYNHSINFADGCFSGCTSLANFSFMPDITEIPVDFFRNCKSLDSIIIPDSVTDIDDGAFSGCTSLSNVTLPPEINRVRGSAFSYCTKLTSFALPKTVTLLGSTVVAGCDSLTSLTVNSQNPNFYSPEGSNAIIRTSDDTLIVGCSSSNFAKLDGIKAIGDYAFKDAKLTDVTIPFTVTSIGRSAFEDSSLQTIVMPDTVNHIGDQAFRNCSSLTKVILSSELTEIVFRMFFDCVSLKQIVIPDKVASIEKEAFKNCSSLSSIVLPQQLNSKTIKESTFENCSSLTDINLPANLVTIENKAFMYCKMLKTLVIPETVTSIGTNLCDGCTSLKKARLPSSTTIIPKCAFQNCNSLFEINLPDSIKEIHGSAFEYCTALTIASLPSSLELIGDHAFYHCSLLPSITIPSTVVSIDESAFDGCTSLVSVTFADDSSLTAIPVAMFSGCKTLKTVVLPKNLQEIGDNAFQVCELLANIDLPDSITKIGSYAFCGCKALKEIKLPNINCLYPHVFDYCASLTSMSLPDSIEQIDNNALSRCSNLSTITLSTSLEHLGKDVFYKCTSLSEVIITNTNSVAVCENAIFEGCPLDKLQIKVPNNLLDEYKKAPNWVVYKNNMVGYTPTK